MFGGRGWKPRLRKMGVGGSPHENYVIRPNCLRQNGRRSNGCDHFVTTICCRPTKYYIPTYWNILRPEFGLSIILTWACRHIDLRLLLKNLLHVLAIYRRGIKSKHQAANVHRQSKWEQRSEVTCFLLAILLPARISYFCHYTRILVGNV